jgi:hypothetical protein
MFLVCSASFSHQKRYDKNSKIDQNKYYKPIRFRNHFCYVVLYYINKLQPTTDIADICYDHIGYITKFDTYSIHVWKCLIYQQPIRSVYVFEIYPFFMQRTVNTDCTQISFPKQIDFPIISLIAPQMFHIFTGK